ncbi:MAG: D-isomer specific 2-hydroxyacid dehydrogenase family protein [Actinomycetota bacterium]|nr:D-isomer specific 2-hydroxyacid dehydrogenase family protein [Actinomycetota bacterium]
MVSAVRRAGGRVAEDLHEADAVVWLDSDPESLMSRLHDGLRWVQLPSAGVRSGVEAGLLDRELQVTSTAGAYAPQVAEHALALLLACFRQLHRYARASAWAPQETRSLAGSTAAIVGAGGIGTALIELLGGLQVQILAVNRSGEAVDGAQATLPASRLDEVWPKVDAVVLSAPETPETHHLVGRAQLSAMRDDVALVNVARGTLVDTAALVEALAEERIGVAALDVTDPEPLPDDHPLWREPRALITCHTANPRDALETALVERVERDVERFAAGEQLLGVVDPDRGY